jgi:hypothetical protein
MQGHSKDEENDDNPDVAEQPQIQAAPEIQQPPAPNREENLMQLSIQALHGMPE